MKNEQKTWWLQRDLYLRQQIPINNTLQYKE